MRETLIFGHKRPDTDSVTSSIALSYFKNELGNNTSPRILGTASTETKYVLDYFDVEEPKYLNDVKLQIRDINYIKKFYINENSSLNECYYYMNLKETTAIPIVDDSLSLVGLVTLKSIAKEMITGNFRKLHTSYNNIIKTIVGEALLKFDSEILGNITAVTYKSTTFLTDVNLDSDDIVIVGDRHSIIEYAVNAKVKMIILVGNANLKEEHLQIAKDNKVNIIRTTLDTFATTKLIGQSSYVKNIIASDNPIVFDQNDYVSNFIDISSKYKHTNYPVIDKENKCLGLVRVIDVNDVNKKRVILVDHNEKLQSVDGIEEADIIEVVDHHKLGDITTSYPINFRNMAVGSTNTIIYNMFKESNVTISKKIAGIMLSGILSDTLLLKSPTTTEYDHVAVKDLSLIANINYMEFGYQMFKKSSSLKDRTIEEILYQDVKMFNVEEHKLSIAQVFATTFDELDSFIDECRTQLNNIAKNNNYDVAMLFITDAINNGSYIIYSDNSKEILIESLNIPNLYEGYYLEGVVSRKKQIIPVLIDYLERK